MGLGNLFKRKKAQLIFSVGTSFTKKVNLYENHIEIKKNEGSTLKGKELNDRVKFTIGGLHYQIIYS